VQYAGQPVFVVAATTVDAARKAAREANVDYDELEAILDPLTAVEKESFVLPSETLVRGEPDVALKNAPHRLQRRVSLGGQDQFYLESHIAMALPQEDGGMLVYSSTQHPDEVQRPSILTRCNESLRMQRKGPRRTSRLFVGGWVARSAARRARPR
jgi:xanthine dehydrogenase large subunit